MNAKKYIGLLLGVGLVMGLVHKFEVGLALLGPGHLGAVLLILLFLVLIVMLVIKVLRD